MLSVRLAAECGSKVHSFRQWLAADRTALPTASAGQCATSNCKPPLFWFPCKQRYTNVWDHSFPWNAEFGAEPQNFPISAEFLCFHGILQNSVLAGDIGDKYGIFHYEIRDSY